MKQRVALFAGLKIAIVVNQADFFLSHRLELALALKKLGASPVLVCPPGSGEDRVRNLDIPVRTLSLSRSGFNPFSELRTLVQLLRLYRQERPDVVHHVTIKPVLYGTLAARLCGIPAVVNAVSGLGYVFTGRGLSAFVRRFVVRQMYRICVRHPNMRVIFQNSEDRDTFLRHRLVSSVSGVIIRGSGVDMQRFRSTPEPTGDVTFLLVARMLADKGVREFIDAARSVRQQHRRWRFLMAGDVDPGNPSTLTVAELEAARAYGIEWLGRRNDMAALMSSVHVVVLPSYREGLPKALLEAAASGRAVITTDIAGCREVVRHEVNGLLVPPRDAAALAAAMRRLGEDGELRRRMGVAGSIRAVAFSVEDVVEHTLRVYAAVVARPSLGEADEVAV